MGGKMKTQASKRARQEAAFLAQLRYLGIRTRVKHFTSHVSGNRRSGGR